MSEPEKPDFVMETYIRTTPEKLWEAITSPGMIARYHFMPVMVTTDIYPGGAIDQKTPDGHTILRQEVISSDTNKRLETTFEPGWAPDLKASRCIYEIEPHGEHCKLTLMHFAIPEGQDGIADGWSKMISSMKSLIETGEPLTFAA